MYADPYNLLGFSIKKLCRDLSGNFTFSLLIRSLLPSLTNVIFFGHHYASVLLLHQNTTVIYFGIMAHLCPKVVPSLSGGGKNIMITSRPQLYRNSHAGDVHLDGLVQGKKEKLRFPTKWIIIHGTGFEVFIPSRSICWLLNGGFAVASETTCGCAVTVYSNRSVSRRSTYKVHLWRHEGGEG